jgi:hydroxyacylglutathione hydrolase
MQAQLLVTPVRAFSDNYIWLVHAPLDPRRVFVVDPGDATPVKHRVAADHLRIAGILATHHHADHVGGIPALASENTGAVYGPAQEAIGALTHRLREGDRVNEPELGLQFEVWSVPGHTSGHIAFVGHGAVFCGDTLFSAGCGRLFEGTPEQMYASLQKLKQLPGDTRVYCAHEYTVSNLKFAQAVEPGNEDIEEYLDQCMRRRARDEATVPSTIRQELKVNPFLRCDQQTVKQAAERVAGRELRSEAEVFATVRKWKDGFKN